jgi:hypothetical protein
MLHIFENKLKNFYYTRISSQGKHKKNHASGVLVFPGWELPDEGAA